MFFDQECHNGKNYRYILRGRMCILVDKQKYSRRNVTFHQVLIFQQNESDKCKNITSVSPVNCPSLNLAESQPTSSNKSVWSCSWQ